MPEHTITLLLLPEIRSCKTPNATTVGENLGPRDLKEFSAKSTNVTLDVSWCVYPLIRPLKSELYHHHPLNNGELWFCLCAHVFTLYALCICFQFHCVHPWVNSIQLCCHIWYSALKDAVSVHHYSSYIWFSSVVFWHDERQLKTALSVTWWGQTLWYVAVVLDPREGWLDENQTCLRDTPGESGEGTGFCSHRVMHVLKNIGSVLLLLH